MVKILGVAEPWALRQQKAWGKPWENLELESDNVLLENSDFLLCEKGGKVNFEANRLLFEDSFKIHLELGRPEFLFWQKTYFLLLENGSKIKTEYPYAHSSFGIYRLSNCREGKLSTKRHFYEYYTAATPARLIRRKKFAGAVPAWKLLTDGQKAWYNQRAVGRHMSGYNLFIKEFMKT